MKCHGISEHSFGSLVRCFRGECCLYFCDNDNTTELVSCEFLDGVDFGLCLHDPSCGAVLLPWFKVKHTESQIHISRACGCQEKQTVK